MKRMTVLTALLLAAFFSVVSILSWGLPDGEYVAGPAQLTDGRVLVGENRRFTSRIYTLRDGRVDKVYEESRLSGGEERRVARLTTVNDAVFYLREINGGEAWELKMNEPLPYIRAALRDFADGAEQADDITMLGITYRGASADGDTLVVPASSDELDCVQAFVDDRLDQLDCPMETRVQIQIAVEELFVNIARYAYAPEQGETVVRCVTEHEPKAVTIEFRDRGKPFDPLAKADADVTLSADERPIGGLGIYMVKTSMDDVRYACENGENVLTIYKKI